MDISSVGNYIRKYRESKGLRQADLAEKSGLSPNYIGALERGEKIPSLESLVNILNALDISADMALCDVVTKACQVKTTQLSEEIDVLDYEERSTIYDIIATFVRHAKKNKP